MDSSSRTPQQARSLRTQQRLLEATIAVLEDKGLAGVTIPEIAAVAGVATGSIYRRFTDKDALIRAAFLQFLEMSQEANRQGLAPERFANLSFEAALHAVARALLRQYRDRPILLTALDQFMGSDSDTDFKDRAVTLIAANFSRLVEALMSYRAHITAADPERAITFALLTAIALTEVHALNPPALWQRMLPMDDGALTAETARTMAAYLTSPGGPA
jgi:AcrR family transcriptional regulator